MIGPRPFYGANRPGANIPKGILDRFWLVSMQCGLVNADLLEFAREKAKTTAPGRRGSAEPASRAASSR